MKLVATYSSLQKGWSMWKRHPLRRKQGGVKGGLYEFHFPQDPLQAWGNTVDGRINQTLTRSMTVSTDLHDEASVNERNKSNPDSFEIWGIGVSFILALQFH